MDFDPKKKVIEELMQYLQSKDDEDLGTALKPAVGEVEVKVEGGDEESKPEAPRAEGLSDGDGDEASAPSGEMSEDELNELIEAMSAHAG